KKIRRIELKKKRELLRKKIEGVEGVIYQSNCGMNILAMKTIETNDPNEFPTKIVYFDLETSGLSANTHILQIGAVCGEQIFNVYIHTKQNISSAATIINANVPEVLKKISGFADSLQLFRKEMPDRKGPGKFKLETFAKDFLQSSDQQLFHNAVDDVIILQTLTKNLLLEKRLSASNKIESNLQFVSELQGILSINMCKKLALNNITFENLLELYKKEGERVIIKLFTEKVDNKSVRITKRKAIITKVIKFLKTTSK
ncbi:hypothetical protein PV326_014398, partial [Microctonus aethiopoides]